MLRNLVNAAKHVLTPFTTGCRLEIFFSCYSSKTIDAIGVITAAKMARRIPLYKRVRTVRG